MNGERNTLLARYRGSYLSSFLIYTFYFCSLALFSGLISIYLLEKGYTTTQVSFVVSCSLAASMLIQPVIGALNDRFSAKLVTGTALLSAAILGILFLFADSLWLIAVLYSLTVGLSNSAGVVVERSATQSRYPYRFIRIWGTIGYAVGCQLGGVIYRYISPGSMFLFFALSVALCVLGLVGFEPKEQIPPQKSGQEKPGTFWTKDFFCYLLIACVFNGITSLNSTYLPAMFQSEGIPVDLVSTVTFALTLSELPLIFFSNKFMDRFSNTQLLSAVFVMQIVQYAVYGLVPVAAVQILAAILLKATSTMALIMLNLKIVASIVGENRQITALAMVATFKSLTAIAFQTAGGALLEHLSYPAFYLVLLAVSAAGLALCLFSRLPDGKRLQMFS